jgi:hypothetical protein
MMQLAWGGLAAIVFFLQSPSSAPSIFVPTSDVIDIARKIARDQGFPIERHKLFYFDLMRREDGSPRLPGYVSVGFYGNDRLILDISINEKTGQVVDTTHCFLFEYPDLAAFGRAQRRASHAKALTREELEATLGCESLKASDRSAAGAAATIQHPFVMKTALGRRIPPDRDRDARRRRLTRINERSVRSLCCPSTSRKALTA